MTVLSNENPADPNVHEPRVTGAPEAIWLVYGDLEQDATHAECSDRGEVLWCEDAQFAADVRYTRTDIVAERVRTAVAGERERWAEACETAISRHRTELDRTGHQRHRGAADALENLLRELGPNTKLAGSPGST